MARREEKKQATRQRLVDIATDLFCRKGYDNTTVDEIVSLAGISQRTFFRYFPTKLDVAFPSREKSTAMLRVLLERHQNLSAPLLGVRVALEEYGNWYATLKDELMREWQYEAASPTLIARADETERINEQLITESLETAGVPREQANLLGGVIFGGISAVLREWFDNDCQRELMDVGGDLLRLMEELHRLMPWGVFQPRESIPAAR
jgi:AcrR family transcriptional regulator